MSWLQSDRKVHSDEGIYGTVLVDEKLRILGAENRGMFRNIQRFSHSTE